MRFVNNRIVCVWLAAMLFAFVASESVFAQRLQPGRVPGRVPGRQPVTQQPQIQVPKEINMQNPIPDCEKYMQAGLYKEAFDALQKWTLAPNADPMTVGQGLQMAIACLQNLNRVSEIDEYLDSTYEVHKKNWRFLMAAAMIIKNLPYNGSIIDDKFIRENHDGETANSYELDQVTALFVMQEAMPLAMQDNNKSDVADFFSVFAGMLRNRGQAWKMQILTDLTEENLPDYDKGSYYPYHWNSDDSGTPVDEANNPVYYNLPESFESAKSDGERWRWCLAMMVENNPKRAAGELFERADFGNSQFGVGRLAGESRYNARINEREAFSVKTLADNETVTRLATGIKRFALPDDQNPIVMLKRIIEIGDQSEKNRAIESLAVIAEERMQYVRAAGYYEQLLKDPLNRNLPKEQLQNWTQQLNRITGAWGAFDPVESKVAGVGANLSFNFRNANKVRLSATEIKVPQLLADVKAFLKSNPANPDSQSTMTDIRQIGWQLVNGKSQKYIGAKVADWDVELTPAPEHADKRVTITTPMTKAGAYLVKAETLDPATDRVNSTDNIIVWLNDTAIVTKNLAGKTWIYVADAVTGTPVPNAKVDVFGYQVAGQKNSRNVLITEKSLTTNSEGQATYQVPVENGRYYQYMLAATTKDGRFAHLGFGEIWFSHNYRDDEVFNQEKAFFISDRPVYRPGDTVQYKFWVGRAKYDQPFDSPFANQELLMIITSPRGNEIVKKKVKLDAYGGVAENIELPKDAELGIWNVETGIPYPDRDAIKDGLGDGQFRVEEYKKPEFEVTIDAPKEPVALGETIKAKITAKYYFGSPVTSATVKYKVLRERNDSQWYPVMPWDWFYGNGYGWLGIDATWHPGWASWGRFAPERLWSPGWGISGEQPEVVAEREVPIGDDGTVDVVIDTQSAKLLFPDDDQKYTITAEVVDQSRRTIDGKGVVLVAKKPFEVTTWVDRGYYNQGEQIKATFQARRIDGKPVTGTATVKLLKMEYNQNPPLAAGLVPQPNSVEQVRPLTETVIHEETVALNELGQGHLMLSAAQPGQYRVSCTVNGTIEGATIFGIFGRETAGNTFRFNELELVPSKAEFQPGEEVELRLSTNRPNSTVMLFLRPVGGVYFAPQVVKINGKSEIVKFPVEVKDMPNFFVEAITVSDGKVFEDVREIVVPPVKRIMNVEVIPNSETYKPGQKASVELRVTGLDGKPVVGQNVVAIYDKSLEYISGGSNVANIKEFFWKWRRTHDTAHQTNLSRMTHPMTKNGENRMQPLGANGYMLNSLLGDGGTTLRLGNRVGGRGGWANTRFANTVPMAAGAPMARAAGGMGGMAGGSVEMMVTPMVVEPAAPACVGADFNTLTDLIGTTSAPEGWTGEESLVEATLRKDFADTALWVGAIETNGDGIATVELNMPENLTTWKINVWSMAPGTQVGYATTDVITRKDLIIRMQTPRFLVQRDKILLTANVHNYLATEKQVQVSLEMDGDQLLAVDLDRRIQTVTIPANGEARVDWLVEAKNVGDATVRMKALTNEESDAMQMTFPVQVHGMLKQEAFSGVIRPTDSSGKITVQVPEQRVPEQSRLTVRFSPTLAGAMIDALPYLADYPYGCTEQTLNRFLPTVITQKVLIDSGVDLASLEKAHANLNAQELGDPAKRAAQWQRNRTPSQNPVYSQDEVRKMANEGVKRLTEMQCSDDGWGWFSGYGERSSVHLTAQVVRGLRIAQQNDVAIDQSVIDRGIQWLRNYQAKQVQLIKNAELPEEERKKVDWKPYADNTDAFICMVLYQWSKADTPEDRMMGYLFRDRTRLSLYGVAMLGIAASQDPDYPMSAAPSQEFVDKYIAENRPNRIDVQCLRMLEQYLEQDDENQTAWLNLQRAPGWSWWNWYGSEYETQAMYLKLLMRVNPKSETAPRLVKWLLNNRKHATYWNSTRDTALCVEAFAEYLRATGEARPNMTVEILVDGTVKKSVDITPENMLTIDNTFILEGLDVTSGTHEIELRRKGTGAVYFNAYLENFTLEDQIKAAGLEVKVDRRYWLLTPADKTADVAGNRGQVVTQKVEKYDRTPIANLSTVKSGQLVEIELIIDSKNDYESLLIEDMKAAGFEPVEVQSGYNGNSMGAYVEYRDNRVTFFVYRLSQGKHAVSYRMRAQQPGQFSALPAKIEAMYAPELKGNSDELKVSVVD